MAFARTEIREAIDRLVDNPTIVALHLDWQAESRERPLPAFERFAPEGRPAIRDSLIVLEPEGGLFRYRYYGERIAAVSGLDPTGHLTSEIGGEIAGYLHANYVDSLALCRPIYTLYEARLSASQMSWESLILPVRDASARSLIVCYCVPFNRHAETFEALMKASLDGIAVLTPVRDAEGGITDFRYEMINEQARAIVGRDVSLMPGKAVSEVLPEAFAERFAVYRQIMETGVPQRLELSGETDGRAWTLRLGGVRAGERLVVTLSDISELRATQRRLEEQTRQLSASNAALEQQAARLAQLADAAERANAKAQAAERFVGEVMESIPIPLFHWTPEGRIGRANRHYAAIYGETSQSIAGRTPEDLLPPQLAAMLRDQHARLLSGEESEQVQAAEIEVPGLGLRRMVAHRSLMRDAAGGPLGIAGALLDMTAEHALRTGLERLATTDPLTGLANRRAFFERAERELRRARRSGWPLCLVILDVDRFKQINDELGHDLGDRVLVHVAEVVSAELRESGDLMARLGGEEFVVLLPDSSLSGAATLAERLRGKLALAAPPAIGLVRRLTASFGVAGVEPEREETVEQLLKRADEALYRAKAAGRNRVEVADLRDIASPVTA